jgi:hypothetical protein
MRQECDFFQSFDSFTSPNNHQFRNLQQSTASFGHAPRVLRADWATRVKWPESSAGLRWSASNVQSKLMNITETVSAAGLTTEPKNQSRDEI